MTIVLFIAFLALYSWLACENSVCSTLEQDTTLQRIDEATETQQIASSTEVQTITDQTISAFSPNSSIVIQFDSDDDFIADLLAIRIPTRRIDPEIAGLPLRTLRLIGSLQAMTGAARWTKAQAIAALAD